MATDISKNSGYGGEGANEAYNPPSAKSSTVRGSHMEKDAVGIQEGLSACSGFDSENPDFPMYDNMRDPITGNVKGRPQPYQDDAISVTSKGNKMSIQ